MSEKQQVKSKKTNKKRSKKTATVLNEVTDCTPTSGDGNDAVLECSNSTVSDKKKNKLKMALKTHLGRRNSVKKKIDDNSTNTTDNTNNNNNNGDVIKINSNNNDSIVESSDNNQINNVIIDKSAESDSEKNDCDDQLIINDNGKDCAVSEIMVRCETIQSGSVDDCDSVRDDVQNFINNMLTVSDKTECSDDVNSSTSDKSNGPINSSDKLKTASVEDDSTDNDVSARSAFDSGSGTVYNSFDLDDNSTAVDLTSVKESDNVSDCTVYEDAVESIVETRNANVRNINNLKSENINNSCSDMLIDDTVSLPLTGNELVKHKSKLFSRETLKNGILSPFLRRKSIKKKDMKDCTSLNSSEDDIQHPVISEHPDDVITSLKKMSFGSAAELSSSQPMVRKPSFIKRKLSQLLKSTPDLQLQRSLSFKDVNVKQESDRKRSSLSRLMDKKRTWSNTWSTSLQSLAEDEITRSYTSLNNEVFGNDHSHECEYDEFGARVLKRTQSLSIRPVDESSKIGRRCGASYSPALARHYQSNLDISNQSGAVSLPALHCLQEHGPLSSYTADVINTNPHRYRRRVQSSSYDDARPCSSGSFRAAGTGCSKLKRYNVGKQRHQFVAESDDTVRSRSLTHLDTLDQSILKPAGSAGGLQPGEHPAGLKDSRSEPDCSMQPHDTLLQVPAVAAELQPCPTASAGGQGSPIAVAATGHCTTASRRHMMSRSQVSSSEYFSVSFDTGTIPMDDAAIFHGHEEFIAAAKGTSLVDALGASCERRGIDLSACEVYLESQRTPLSVLSADTSWLGGKHLRITAKDTSNKKQNSHVRKSSGSYRMKTGNKFFSASTEDPSISPNTSISSSFQEGRLGFQDGESKKQYKQRWSGFFSNNKDTKMEQLVEHLNEYSKKGVPNSQQTIEERTESTEVLYNLEEDWKQLVTCKVMTEKQQQQQTALWELITTEVAYLKMLKVVTNLFLACLQSLQNANILNEVDKTKLFSNITEIHSTNLNFWSSHIYPMLKHTRETGELLNPEFLLPGFLKFNEIFEPYTKYCSDQSKCQHYCREMHSQNELFTAYLVWCETQRECNRLRLMDILVRPMQRLTKYGLLLKAIFKNSELERHKECLTTMIKSVDDFVNSVNSTLKHNQDSESLRRVMARIESYDAVESKDDELEKLVRTHCELDLMKPMIGCNRERRRHLLTEDDFKLKDSMSSSKMEVHCILLTDLLLICKPSTKKASGSYRVVRQPFIVDRLLVTELTREPAGLGFVYLNEFNMAVAAFTLQGDVKKLKSWLEYIRKAQALYRQAKQASALIVRQLSVSDTIEVPDTNLEYEYDMHSLQGYSLVPQRSPLATSSRASRVSSLAHSHSGSVEMNDQSSMGSINQSRAISVETDQRTASISSDEGVQTLPTENPLKSPIAQKNSIKLRLLNTQPKIATPNTLSVQPYGASLGQSLPNLALGSPNTGTLNLISPNQNTLLVPNTKNNQNLLSPNHRGISYPPPSPPRGNLRRSFAINQTKNPPLLKTRHVASTASASTSTAFEPGTQVTSLDIDVPVIAADCGSTPLDPVPNARSSKAKNVLDPAGLLDPALQSLYPTERGISPPEEMLDSFNRGPPRQAIMKRLGRSDNRRYHTAGVVDDIKKSNLRDASTQKRSSWNCGTLDQTETRTEDHT